MAAHKLLKESSYKVDGQDLLFWQDPWNADGQRIAVQIRPILSELRLHAERALTLVAEARNANPNLRETDALDVLELGARRMDLIGLKFQVVVMAIGIGVFLFAAVGWFIQAGRRHAAASHGEPGAGH